ncbi:MAG: sigma 54-interacting transcriptional regulator, partial [Planctomycetota bacterium]|nr:sigma 54-interacting transcriptional regulator [Planctomycetota bacterium]
MTAFLILKNGEEETQTLQIAEEITTVGRGEENHLQIHDIKSSRNHCHLERHNQKYKLVDLESQNGTRVNGLRVNKKMLDDGDEIQIGKTVIFFELRPDPQPGKGSGIVRRKRPRSTSPSTKKRKKSIPKPPTIREESSSPTDFQEIETRIDSIEAKEGYQGVLVVDELLEHRLKRGSSSLKQLSNRHNLLLSLQEVNKALNSERSQKKLLDLMIDSTLELTGAERGLLILQEGDELQISAARNIDHTDLKNPELEFSRSIAREVIQHGHPLISPDAQTDDRLAENLSVCNLKLRSVMCIPLIRHDRTLGAVYIDNRQQVELFNEDDLDILETFADQAAIALENARLNEENSKKQIALENSRQEVVQLNELLRQKVQSQSIQLDEAKENLEAQQAQLELKYNYDRIIGSSKAMQNIFLLLDKITDSQVSVFIQGESGTGKELVARSIHFNGPRKESRFVSENCAAISETLLESELFGYVKGAFTGADEDKKGLFEISSGGTLFLDEIGDMSSNMQTKLLRVLQENEIRRVGSTEPIAIDVRVISASNKNLRQLVHEGTFREDLYYRVNVIALTLPPLRDRREDIHALWEHFVSLHCENKEKLPQIDRGALRLLLNYD